MLLFLLTFNIIVLKGVILVNRVEIKAEAKEKVKDWGVKWNIIWPLLVIGAITAILSSLFGSNVTININDMQTVSEYSGSPISTIGSFLVTILGAFLSAGYIKYLLTFVRTGKFDTNVIIDTIKDKWLNILIAEILVGIIVFACTLLFVVPGIIMSLAYTFAIYLVVDKDVAGNDSLKMSREMMKGYKWDYFVFGLSFIGWILLIPFTLGIICIWLIPYMNVASTLYYENLQKKLGK